MANVSINLLYDELKRVRQELHSLNRLREDVHELKRALIPEEEIGEDEREELHATVAEMKGGKERSWRAVFGK